MDNLAKEAMLARQSDMSYGKWKMLQPVKPKKQEKKIPEGWKTCEYCGKAFKPTQGKRFCEIECRNEAYRDKRYQKEENGIR